jgi:hypothetical protein
MYYTEIILLDIHQFGAFIRAAVSAYRAGRPLALQQQS